MSTDGVAQVPEGLAPATLELLLRLDGLTARLENAVVALERTVGEPDDDA